MNAVLKAGPGRDRTGGTMVQQNRNSLRHDDTGEISPIFLPVVRYLSISCLAQSRDLHQMEGKGRDRTREGAAQYHPHERFEARKYSGFLYDSKKRHLCYQHDRKIRMKAGKENERKGT